MKHELLPINGDPPIPLTRDITLVGRREFCDLQIPHVSLSKRHCLLVRTDELLIVRDLISTNGTKVNGQPVSWAPLIANDRLTLGRVTFKIYAGKDDMAAPSERPAASRPSLAPTLDDDFDDNSDDEFIPVAEPARPAHNPAPVIDGLDILDDDDPPPPLDDEFLIDLE